ncbi:MAG: PLP-dependent transferase, partial [Cytophaga sp.]|uniref:PLP-dependent transferase n=1 Tax=Cytophaga sp. TaxID=29535 RepID=UPI003F81CCE9
MTAITISDLYNHAHIKVNELPKTITNEDLLLELEKQVAILEGGKNALAKKTFRSARFSLIKHLLAVKHGNVLSFESRKQWEADAIIYKRIGTNIIFVEDHSADEWENLLAQHAVSIIYISTIQQQTLTIEDFGYIIYKAHLADIPVIFDNTHGGLGHIYAPLIDGADFVLTDVSASPTIFKNIPVKS